MRFFYGLKHPILTAVAALTVFTLAYGAHTTEQATQGIDMAPSYVQAV